MVDSHMIQEFETEFRDLLEGAEDQFRLPPAPSAEELNAFERSQLSDIDRLQLTESHLKQSIARAKAEVDVAQQDLQIISRDYQAAQQTEARTLGSSDKAAHEQRMAKATHDRLAEMKKNRDLDHELSKAKTELDSLKQQLLDEEADAVEVAELNSEVLRIKMYRDFGFTPVEENGVYKKVLVRSSKTNQASTIAIDSNMTAFWTTNFLWDTLNA